MIKHSVVKCNFCEERILLRFQVGYFDIPFDFYCPTCGVSICGNQSVCENKLSITNAEDIGEEIERVKYYGNFSVEFPNKKISEFNSIEDIIRDGFGPFMNTTLLFGSNEEYIKVTEKIGKFLNFKEEIWKDLFPLYELLFNGKTNLIEQPLLNYSKNYVIKNELDATISLHQLATIGMSNIMPKNTLSDYSEIANKLMLGKETREIIKFINYLKNKIDNKELSKKIVLIYDRWILDFEKYMAVITLCMGNKTNDFDKEKYGITTINFEDMKSFFMDSYELTLEMTVLAVGLNNIMERSKYDCFSDKSNVKNFDSFYNQTKSDRTKSLIEGETYSNYLNIDRHVRNAIAHYDYDINKQNQLVTFHDKFKDKSEKVEMYLFDFALICYENIKTIIYLNELFYTLKKINYIHEGLMPHINYKF